MAIPPTIKDATMKAGSEVTRDITFGRDETSWLGGSSITVTGTIVLEGVSAGKVVEEED